MKLIDLIGPYDNLSELIRLETYYLFTFKVKRTLSKLVEDNIMYMTYERKKGKDCDL